MTDLLERAIQEARHLPPERQDDVARLMLDYTRAAPFELTEEEDAALDVSEAAAARGEFASDEKIRAIWAKHGL